MHWLITHEIDKNICVYKVPKTEVEIYKIYLYSSYISDNGGGSNSTDNLSKIVIP